MSDPQTKAEMIERLREVQDGLSVTVRAIPPAHFDRGTAQDWSPASYLKHLLLAVKPFAKGISYPPAQIKRMFGEPDHPSRSYAELVTFYQSRLAEGVRAEDFPNIIPDSYRMPEGIAAADVQMVLVQTWDDAHNKLFDGLAHWSETDLDTHQFQHAALGMITAREVLFFTLFHNTLHWNDIRAASTAV